MNRATPFAALLFLTLVAASTSSEVQTGPDSRSVGQVARIPAPGEPDLARLDRAIPVESPPLASNPVDEALQAAASTSVKEFSGGPTGALLIGVALVAAIALLLAVAIPW